MNKRITYLFILITVTTSLINLWESMNTLANVSKVFCVLTIIICIAGYFKHGKTE